MWTFQLSGLAYAFKDDQQPTVKQPAKAESEKKINKNFEEIETILKDEATSTETKKDRLRKKKSELETNDAEIRKIFVENEKTIKEKGLPPEILERHRMFVKQYEDRYRELQTDLDAIDKAKTEAEAGAEMEKAKALISKLKPPRKYKPLDPNNLPVKSPEEKQVALEEKKPERKRPAPVLKRKAELLHHAPILVAADGPLKGLLNSDSQLMAQNDILLAQAGTLASTISKTPTPEDYQETPETRITPAIRAKAAELENKPWKIYYFVLNNIDFVPTWGSIQGADMCLQTKQCNDTDTASLMIALFRAAGYPARYSYATMEMPIDKFMNWVGGFTDPIAALNFAASAGMPVRGITEGGKITAAQFEHVWSQVRVLYGPFRGMGGVDNYPTWLPLDGSIKYFNYSSGIDIKTAVPFDSSSFVDQIKTSATINETEGYVTNVNSSLIQQTMQDYQTRVQNYLTQNYPNATIDDILGKKEIKQRRPWGLPVMTRIKAVNVYWNRPTLPDNLIHKVTFSVTSDNIYYDAQPLIITKLLPEIAGKKITLSYSPATTADEAVINSYLPTPRPAGTPIEPNEIPNSLPAYLIKLKPELRIDGTVVATGGAIGMGEIEQFTISLTQPSLSPQVVNNKVIAGEFNAFMVDIAKISPDQATAIKNNFDTLIARVHANDAGLTKDDTAGNLLYLAVFSYFAELDQSDNVSAKTMGIISVRLPSIGRFFNALNIDYSFGAPLSASSGGLSMDIGLIRKLVRTLDGTKDRRLQFMLSSGLNSSVLEHSIPEQLFSTQENPIKGISAVRAFQLANDQGIPIYSINQSNISAILPLLQIDQAAKTDIQNAVNAGKIAVVSKNNITFNGWTGCGYIIGDPNTGAGAYMIAGGLAGAYFAKMDAALVTIESPYTPLHIDYLKNWIESKPPAIVLTAASYAGVGGAGAIGGGYAGVGSVSAALSALDILTLAFLISVMIDEVTDRSDDMWWTFRHYTTPANYILIMNSQYIMMDTTKPGDLGIGSYITDFPIEPNTPENRRLMCTAINKLDDVCLNEYTTYVTVQVDEFIMVRLKQGKLEFPGLPPYEHQYMLPLVPWGWLGPITPGQEGHVIFQ